jgi:CobQ/CobB/MinD/ParA nucleotide binding domain
MSGIIRFDDSLSALADVVTKELGHDALIEGAALRDTTGRLAFFVPRAMDEATSARITIRLRAALGSYARTDRVLAGSDDYSTNSILADPSAIQITAGEHRIRLVDRRLVGTDWLREPAPPAPGPPRFVFASLKGGVGRSTALAVVAMHLASHGKRVLAIDLDLEAPGLGWTLLSNDTLPLFGMLDALVENGISGLDQGFLADLVSPSSLAEQTGRIDVIPAYGSRSRSQPADVLAKIARAYTEDIRPDGTMASILDQVRTIVDRVADSSRYDAILLDARAGLHETAASSILGLGAEVLLFGLDEPQTFGGYRVLLSHLARFIRSRDERPEWADRLTMVQGKAPVDAGERQGFADRCRTLFEEAGFHPPVASGVTSVPLPEGASFSEVPWNDDISDSELFGNDWTIREPIAILDDARFHRFDPMRKRDLVSERVYRTAFGELLDCIDESFDAAEEDR